MIRVLLVDDDENDMIRTRDLLAGVDGTRYETGWAATGERARALLASGGYDVCVVDHHVDRATGIGIVTSARADGVEIPFILVTDQADREVDLAAMRAGVSDLLVRGSVEAPVLERSIRYAIQESLTVRSLRESEGRFRSVIESASDAVLLIADDGQITGWNHSAEAIFDQDKSGFTSMSVFSLLAPPNDVPDATMEGLLNCIEATSGPTSPYETCGRRRDGSVFPIELALSRWNTTGGRCWSAVVRDVTERKLLEAQLTRQAFHDPLTGLANRGLFRNRVEHALARISRRTGSIAVLFLDLDDFKKVNDTLGHGAGDELLNLVAGRISGCVRPTDTVARLGGDEFAILLEEAHGPEAAMIVAERLLARLERPFGLAARDVNIRASVGLAITTSSATKVDELLRNADMAMYAAKGAGKGRYAVFEDGMHAALLERVELEDELRLAVASAERELSEGEELPPSAAAAPAGRLTVHYQPIVELATGRIHGFEALVRWVHPKRGMLAPALFVPLAEETGLVSALGHYVLATACSQISAWQRQFGRPDLTVSVNLSGRQLEDRGLFGMVAKCVAGSGLESGRLTLEIAERALVDHHRGALDVLDRLRALGVRIAVDDFGTGYSSLAYLQDLAVDVLKIDRSFLRRVGEERGDGLLRAIVAMGHHLGMEVVAEGIEAAEHASAATGAACDLGQGFHFARPMPAEQAATLMGGISLDEPVGSARR